ncbi:MAG: PEP-CTERM sorting domain-containing protein [Phycisphaerae bacterium]|nr:PEP-CTERM sorting domain-containing protein [Phycisphaerae bacterium]NIS51388.1 PEP-CTERM sorting domain-containing protein [Phycisphaerae bacterium]NIU09003.1 PEP-CTERM sorting domain-containing protein [Phycisphaerae bacterium]NIU56663.1 PEP-CTERM sorting domain-containing protein [Phycisphaerae bacterium]NIV00035.1 PEP-CTERM sorting domain-containing protein [Phycisphaerae bacterium]
MIVEGTPVPEPATVILLALGVIGLCAGRRKR